MSTNQNKVSMCCETCSCGCQKSFNGGLFHCGNSDCPCHTEKGGEESGEGISIIPTKRNCKICNADICGHMFSSHSFSMEETWEQRFDKIYSIFPAGHFSEQLIPNGDGEKKKPIKAFINQEIQSAIRAEQENSLSELIKACGKNFLHLTHAFPGTDAAWSCDSYLEDIDIVYGKTPEEAVRKLLASLK